MAASVTNPSYSVYIVSGGTKYDVTPALMEIAMSESKRQISQSANILLANIKVGETWLTSIFKVRDRVFIYANDGSKNGEVFRGFVWTRGYKSALTEREFQLKCYDHLIYLQESEDYQYFAPGKTTKDIFSTICGNWGVNLEYSYSSITHPKLALRGKLADIMTADVLDPVKDRVGTDYVIRSSKDVMQVMTVGQNSDIYQIVSGKNAVSTYSQCTMDGMKTKVVIFGKADEDDREPVEATVSGDTTQYGTLQKTIHRSENTTLEDSKEEANNIIKADGKPKWEYQIKGPDIPWVRKGDKVYVNAGDIAGKYLIVSEVDRTISNREKQMTLSCLDV